MASRQESTHSIAISRSRSCGQSSSAILLCPHILELTSDPYLVLRCDIEPSLVAVWWSDALALRLSGFAAQTLADAKKLDLKKLEQARPKEYDTRKQATGQSISLPSSCSASYLMLTLSTRLFHRSDHGRR